jgi:phosphatidylglycerol:prolipoprotein diacylglycerol transferase
MHPEIITICGITIQTYGLMMAIGFILCYTLATNLAKRTGRNPDEVQTIVMLAAIAGVLGARMVYVWQNWSTEFASNPLAMFKIWQGGLVFYGGFILATLAMLVYARLKQEPLRSLTDFCAIFIPLGHAFGRIGCFFYGCCYGEICKESAIAVAFPKGSPPWLHQVADKLISPYAAKSLPVFPIQLLEAAGCALLFGILWWTYIKFRHLRGLCSGIYCAGYALLRFTIECFRNDPRGNTYFGLSFSQTISVALLVAAACLICFALKGKNNGPVHR